MKSFLNNTVESWSLTFFLLYVHLVDVKVRADWLWPYLLASLLGVAAIIYLNKKHIVLNRIFLGSTLYFCSGFLGLVSGWDWLNQLYAEQEAAAMLYWVLAVGAVSTIVSPFGFLGIKSRQQFFTLQASLLLFLACILATVMASFFVKNVFLGQWLPFIFIFSMRSFFQYLDKRG